MNECCNQVAVKVRQGVTVSDNYNRLSNKPSINGVELIGNKKAEQLNLLSNNPQRYETLTLGAADRGSFLLLLTEDKPKKIELREVVQGRFQTVEKLPENLESGDYVFLKKEVKKNGTDNK